MKHNSHEKNQIVSAKYSNAIWWTAWLNLYTGLYGLWQGHTYLAPCMFGIWGTSLLYWKNPVFGWRRRLDISFCQLAIWYHIYKALDFDTSIYIPYYTLLAIGFGCYPIGYYYHWNKNDHRTGTIMHMCVHIIPNIATLYFYKSIS